MPYNQGLSLVHLQVSPRVCVGLLGAVVTSRSPKTCGLSSSVAINCLLLEFECVRQPYNSLFSCVPNQTEQIEPFFNICVFLFLSIKAINYLSPVWKMRLIQKKTITIIGLSLYFCPFQLHSKWNSFLSFFFFWLHTGVMGCISPPVLSDPTQVFN